jgi:hypothetical protein
VTTDDEHPGEDTDEQLPQYPGWNVGREGRNYLATRVAPISSYAETWGAVEDIDAGSVAELTLLVLAQTHLASMLAEAEKLDEAGRPGARTDRMDQADDVRYRVL